MWGRNMESGVQISKRVAPARQSRCRWLRFRLRTLLFAPAVVAIPLSWIAWRLEHHRQECRAAAALEAIGGGVLFEDKLGPAWLRRKIGGYFPAFFATGTSAIIQGSLQPSDPAEAPPIDPWSETDGGEPKSLGPTDLEPLRRFGNLNAVTISRCTLHDDPLSPLDSASQLEWLLLRETNACDNDLRHIRSLAKLEVVDISDTDVGDAGLASFKHSTKLKTLYARRSKILGSGLSCLQGLPSLEAVVLGWSPAGNDGLEHLESLPKLIHLETGTGVTDIGLEVIGRLVQLKSLRLDGSQITDSGLENLRGLVNLESLRLCGTRCTDDGLKVVSSLPALFHLDIRRTEITAAGIAHLSTMPNLRSLNLAGTPVDDQAVSLIGAFPMLQSVGLHNTAMTPAGIKRLEAMKPYYFVDISTPDTLFNLP